MTQTRGSLRIVRLANFVTPVSGGLRTALNHLGAGYQAAGHESIMVVPGGGHSDVQTPQGRVVTLPGVVIPGSGGYRMLTRRKPLARLLDELRPDRLEVSDRTTLRWTGDWARERGIPAVMVSHESAEGLLRTWGLPESTARSIADRLNTATARAYDTVVCTTGWAAAEFHRIGARNVVKAPLGVDLDHNHPDRRDPAVRARWAEPDEALLVLCSRLSPEKRPDRALDALAELRRRGVRAVLVIAGEGPLRTRLADRASAQRLPVRFLGHLADRGELAALLASADAAIAPGPVETFGLAALEALACGTPAAVSRSSALPQIVGCAGAAAADTGEGFADAVQHLLARPEAARREAARTRAECFGWPTAVDAFLAVHGASPVERPALADAVSGTAPTQAPGLVLAGAPAGPAAQRPAARLTASGPAAPARDPGTASGAAFAEASASQSAASGLGSGSGSASVGLPVSGLVLAGGAAPATVRGTGTVAALGATSAPGAAADACGAAPAGHGAGTGPASGSAALSHSGPAAASAAAPGSGAVRPGGVR